MQEWYCPHGGWDTHSSALGLQTQHLYQCRKIFPCELYFTYTFITM
jgi:hypothetical protein